MSTKIVKIPDFTIEFEPEDHLSKLDHKSISEVMPGRPAVLTIKIKKQQLLFSPGEIWQSQECTETSEANNNNIF